MSIQKATSLAAEVLNLSWDGDFPVNPKDIAEDLLIRDYSERPGAEKIPVVVRGRPTSELGQISGQARLASNSDGSYYVCEFNRDEVSYRRRFTIAHELGHVVLGHVDEVNAPKRDTTFTNADSDERDANAFAASLLMPEKYVKKFYRSASSVQELADAFGVSTAAMNFRLKNLGII